MSHTAILALTASAVIGIVILIVKLRFNPVVALVLGAAYLGLVTNLGVTKTVETISTGFGELMAEIGLLVGFGVILGAILRETRRDPTAGGVAADVLRTQAGALRAGPDDRDVPAVDLPGRAAGHLRAVGPHHGPQARPAGHRTGRRRHGDLPGVRHRASRSPVWPPWPWRASSTSRWAATSSSVSSWSSRRS